MNASTMFSMNGKNAKWFNRSFRSFFVKLRTLRLSKDERKLFSRTELDTLNLEL
jgi:hypothetical protein